MWEESILEEFQSSATNYPTKALIEALKIIFEQQQERLSLLKGAVDGKSWDPSSWTQD